MTPQECPECARLREELERVESALVVISQHDDESMKDVLSLRTENAALRKEVERLKVHASAAVKQGEHWHAIATAAEARCTALAKTLESAAAAFSNSGNDLMAGICDDATRNHQS